MKKKFGLGYFLQIDIKLDIHVYYVLLINIFKNKFFSRTDKKKACLIY